MIESDKTTESKFRYVFDVYVDNNAPVRFKTPPNPNGKGLIDVNALVAAQIFIPDNLPFLSSTSFYDGEYLAARVYILAGEEYATTPTGASVIYDGLGNVGSPAYGLYADSNFRPAPNATTPVVAWASGQSPETYYNWLALGGEEALEYEMALGQVNDTGGKFLTSCPYSPQTIRSDEDFTLTWFNYNFESATGPEATPFAMKLTTFQNGATVGATGFLNIASNGGTWTSCSTVGTGATATAALLNSFAINMASIPFLIPGTFDTATLQLFPKAIGATAACTLGATGTSEIITLTIDDTNCWGFEPIRFTWLNPLGGRDWFTFMKRNTHVQQASRTTLYRVPGYWSAASYSVQDNQPARYGTTIFKNDIMNTWTASTDWLTEEQSAWLRTMFASPSVFAYLPGRTQPVGIVIQDAEYSVQTIRRENLFQYFVSFVETLPDNVQSY
jgi:hypothetical protein